VQSLVLGHGPLVVVLLTRDELHHGGDAVLRYHSDLPDRVYRDAAPVRPTEVRRHDERPPHARRREDAFVAEAVDRDVACGAVRFARAPDAVPAEAMRAEGRGQRGEWLGA